MHAVVKLHNFPLYVDMEIYEEKHSQYYLNCTNLTESQLNHMNLSRGLTAAVCVIILAIILVVLCTSKAYSSIMQRLYLYLILATIFRELCLTATLEHQYYYEHQDQVCVALGFVTHYASIVVILSALGVILFTMVSICATMKCQHLGFSLRRRLLLEIVYVILIIALPLLTTLAPLITGNYGLALAWCWIRVINRECEEVALEEQLILGYGGYEVVSVAGILSIIVLAITYCKMAADYPRVKKLLLQSLTLTSFVLLFLLFTNTAFAIRIYSGITGWTYHYEMWLFHGVIIPLCQLIIPVGFLGSFYFRHFYVKCCKKHARRHQYRKVEDQRKTFHTSSNSLIPSSTFFHVPYTDGFTSVRGTDLEQGGEPSV